MRRKLYISGLLLLMTGGLLFAPIYSTGATDSNNSQGKSGSSPSPKPASSLPLTVSVRMVGPDQAAMDEARDRAVNAPSVQRYLIGNKYRIVGFELINPEFKGKGDPPPPELFRETIYDYTNSRTIIVDGSFKKADLSVALTNDQPLPSEEEFQAAIEIAKRDPQIGAAIRDGKLVPYHSMPPIIETAGSGDHTGRTLTVGLRPTTPDFNNEIIAVNMLKETVVRFSKGSPDLSLAAPTACGVPSAGQTSTGRGVAGTYEVVINQGQTEIWRFTATRPSASSGTRASGIELNNVTYKGKKVLNRAHAPILNVQYTPSLCGPYRDWQYQEGMLVANGTDVAPGFRLCDTPPQTILDNGTDTGNFLGVAVYISGPEVQLISEMQAGWYRYISEWRFHQDGTIRPRFGFDGVTNSCICNIHHHHVYWRFDFDIDTSANNIVYEDNLRSWPNPLTTEIKRIRDTSWVRRWYIQNVASGDTYAIVPGDGDGKADTYARGDVWVLQYHSNELDDGHNSTSSNTEADLDQFVTGESVQNQDIVVWYAAHFIHDELGGTAIHIVGPDLIKVAW